MNLGMHGASDYRHISNWSELSPRIRYRVARFIASEERIERVLLTVRGLPQPANVSEVIRIVAKGFEVGVDDMLAKTRAKQFEMPRKLAMILVRIFCDIDSAHTARLFGRDPSTIRQIIVRRDPKIGAVFKKYNIPMIEPSRRIAPDHPWQLLPGPGRKRKAAADMLAAKLATPVVMAVLNAAEPVSVGSLKAEMAKAFGLTVDQITAHERDVRLAWPRHVAMCAAHRLLGAGPAKIGRLFGFHEATVIEVLRNRMHIIDAILRS